MGELPADGPLGAAPAPPLEAGRWRLRLYVAGETPRSTLAVSNLRAICEQHLSGRYEIEVIDLLVRPQLARGDEIFAIPTLVRRLPLPLRTIVGDLSDTERVLVGLQIVPLPPTDARAGL